MLTYELKITGSDEKHTKRFLEAVGCTKPHGELSWPPPNAKRVEEKEFWAWRSMWSPLVEAYGGHIRVGGEHATATVYFADSMSRRRGGFVVLFFREYQKERVEYWSWIACQHTFDHRLKGNCWHEYICTKCGDKYEVDSSG